jgi:hypothetical protein
VLRQLLRPAAKKPANQWERGMAALDKGDAKGVWLAVSGVALKASLPVVAVSLVVKLATGEGLPVRMHQS